MPSANLAQPSPGYTATDSANMSFVLACQIDANSLAALLQAEFPAQKHLVFRGRGVIPVNMAA